MRWQYWENPFGKASCWVYTDGGLIICHQARLPVPVCIDGRRACGVLTVDVATHADYRRHGLFSRLLKAANEAECEQGLEVGISFRGEGSMLPQWSRQQLAPLTHFIFPLDVSWLAERLRVPRVLARAFVRRPKARDPIEARSTSAPDVTALWEVLAPSMRWGVVRDEGWWTWRFDGHPHRPYRHFVLRDNGRLSAAAVVRMARRDDHVFGDVLELIAASPRAARRLVCGIAAEVPGSVALTFLTQRESDEGRLVRSIGFRPTPRRLESNPLVLNLRDMCEAGLDLRPDVWRTTWADMDHL
jgi:hypothetical protein